MRCATADPLHPPSEQDALRSWDDASKFRASHALRSPHRIDPAQRQIRDLKAERCPAASPRRARGVAACQRWSSRAWRLWRRPRFRVCEHRGGPRFCAAVAAPCILARLAMRRAAPAPRTRRPPRRWLNRAVL